MAAVFGVEKEEKQIYGVMPQKERTPKRLKACKSKCPDLVGKDWGFTDKTGIKSLSIVRIIYPKPNCYKKMPGLRGLAGHQQCS